MICQVQLTLCWVGQDQFDCIGRWLLPTVSLRGGGNVLPNNTSVDTLKVTLGIEELIRSKVGTVLWFSLKNSDVPTIL